MAEYGDFEKLDVNIEEKFEYKKILFPHKYKNKSAWKAHRNVQKH